MSKQRLDSLLVEAGLAVNRTQARGLILAGQVLVDGSVSDKAGVLVPTTARVTVQQGPAFVSRGGAKLAAALDQFGVDVRGMTCADVGASTGALPTACCSEGPRT